MCLLSAWLCVSWFYLLYVSDCKNEAEPNGRVAFCNRSPHGVCLTAERSGSRRRYPLFIKILNKYRTRARKRVRALNLSAICNILPSFCAELNAVQSAYTPTCNICVTDTTFNVVRPIGLVVTFRYVKLPPHLWGGTFGNRCPFC